MEVIERIIPFKQKDKMFHIYPVGDIHSGAIMCDEDSIKEKVREIKETKNAIVIGMGDYIDAILGSDKRFDIVGHPQWVKKDNIIESERQFIKELFTPIKDKIVTMLTGNHEESVHLTNQNDITRNLCDDLEVPYGGYQCFVNLIFRRENSNEAHQFITHAWHGAGSAQTEGARQMRLVRLVNDIQADIYLMGHLHAIQTHTPDRLVLRNGRVKSTRLIAAITGSWLKTYAQPHKGETYTPSYGERAGYKPARIGCPVIHIDVQKNEFTVES